MLPFEEKKIGATTEKFRSAGAVMRPYDNYGQPDFFTEEDVLKLLKLSPTALKKALDGSEWKGSCYFEEMLLASIILDSCTYHNFGYGCNPLLSIEIIEPGTNEVFCKRAGTPSHH